MKRPAVLAVIAFAVLVVGALLLKGFGDQAQSDPVASVDNGAPRGLLALALLLREQRHDVHVASGFDEPVVVAPGDVVLAPPPERSSWSDAEATALFDAVSRGAHLVIACDDEAPRNDRLKALLTAAGVECVRADVAIGDEAVTKGVAALPGTPGPLWVRGTGRARPKPAAAAWPAWLSGSDAVVVKRAVGAGSVTVVGSATLLANDGIARDDNAAFALRELAPAQGGRVIVDERHHRSRSRAAVLSAAARGTGPLTALAAFALLVPLSLLALAPRPGDPPRDDDDVRAPPAAEASARALAALLVHAERGADVDREPRRRRSSPP